MNIGIIAAVHNDTASTVYDSIECFSKYGNNNYFLVPLIGGEIYQDIKTFDALIIHYSCIAYPYRYHLPISAISSLKIKDFKDIKIALVQDEQRAVLDRLKFLNEIEVSHVFSVANEDLHEILYSSQVRNFTVSTVLTGYISEKHLALAKQNVALIDRKLDLLYRGRNLPSWMGKNAALKGQIQDIIAVNPKMQKYNVSASSTEKSRVYGEDWFKLLLQAKVSIITPSGSDFIDFDGKYLENWVEKSNTNLDYCREPVEHKYQVISPRYFDSVAAGNYLAITPGQYSQIPIDGTYSLVGHELEELPDVIEFTKTAEGQKIVEFSKAKILGNEQYHYKAYVALVEEKIQSLISGANDPVALLDNNYIEFFTQSRLNKKYIRLIKHLLPRKILLSARDKIIYSLFPLRSIKLIGVQKQYRKFLKVRNLNWYMLFNIRLLKEFLIVRYALGSLENIRAFAQYVIEREAISDVPRDTNSKKETLTFQKKVFQLDFNALGKTKLNTELSELSKLANNDKPSLLKFIDAIVETK